MVTGNQLQPRAFKSCHSERSEEPTGCGAKIKCYRGLSLALRMTRPLCSPVSSVVKPWMLSPENLRRPRRAVQMSAEVMLQPLARRRNILAQLLHFLLGIRRETTRGLDVMFEHFDLRRANHRRRYGQTHRIAQ